MNDESVERVMGLVEGQLKGAVTDGMEIALEFLKASEPHISPENQTWGAAVASLAVFFAEAKARSDA